MALYTIADLHLSSDGTKSMEAFGQGWQDYMTRITENWKKTITNEDTVIVPGDISWALKLEETREDLSLLDSLPGEKYLGKGNHDFWWSTVSKMNTWFSENGWHTLHFLYNNALVCGNYVLCGSRGWFVEPSQQKTVGTVDYNRIVNREIIRLTMSLEAGKKLSEETGKPILVFLHFPPVWNEFSCDELMEVLQKYGIKAVYFGHIHGYQGPTAFTRDGIRFRLISADALHFLPHRIPERIEDIICQTN